MMSVKKIVNRIIFVVFTLLVVLLAVRAVWNIGTGASLTRYLKKAAADGLPLKFADLGPPCPAGESAAPLWKAADALFDNDSIAAASRAGSPFGPWLNGTEPDSQVRAAYEAAILKNRRPIDLYLESADRSCGRDPERISIFDRAPILTKRIYAARLISIEAGFRSQAGDVLGGLDECLKGLKFVRLSLDEPDLLNTLVSIGCMKMLVICLDRVVDGHAVDPERLRAFFRVLSSADWYEAFRGHVKAERVYALEMWEAVLKSGKVGPWLFRPLLRSQFARYLMRLDDMERIYGLPRAERAGAIQEFDRRTENPAGLAKLVVGLLPKDVRPGDPTIGSTALKESTLEALMDTARIGLAARIFRMREGRWPESPAALVPEFLDKEPLDPFSGKSYVYRAGQDGLLVYSVGANLKDEGGRGTYMITQLVMPKDDDWAWRDSFKK
jgi:hypothetical protein